MQQFGKCIFLAGIGLAILGAAIWLFGNKFGWFGKLPGDIKMGGDNFHFYAPLGSMLVISIILSFLLWLVRKFLS